MTTALVERPKTNGNDGERQLQRGTATVMPTPASSMSLGQLGKMFADSGFFQDSRQAAQACVKIQAGAELGFPPVASMTGIYIVKGKVSLSANLIAAAIKRSGKYNYRILQLDNTGCRIAFTENGQQVGESSFTVDDAKKAGLSGDNWSHYPRNMFFARTMSNGAKWYCAEIFGGPVYTPEELGEGVDGTTGEPEARIAPLPPLASADQVREIKDLLNVVRLPDGTIDKWFAKAGVDVWEEMPAEVIDRCIAYTKARTASAVSVQASPVKPEAAEDGGEVHGVEDSHRDAEPSGPDVSSWASTLDEARSLGMELDIAPSVFETGVAIYLVKIGKKGVKAEQTTEDERRELLAQIAERRDAFAPKS